MIKCERNIAKVGNKEESYIVDKAFDPNEARDKSGKWTTLYHGTTQDYDPTSVQLGTHFGTKRASLDRLQEATDRYAEDNTNEPWNLTGIPELLPSSRIHEYVYKPSGKVVSLSGDLFDEMYEKGSPAEDAESIAWDLVGKHFTEREAKQVGESKFPVNTLSLLLKEKGISALKYRNEFEGVGSSSYIIYDPQNLTYKKTLFHQELKRFQK